MPTGAYNQAMRLVIAILLTAAGLWAQQAPPPGLVDEDEDILPAAEYVFNPIQARKDLKIGRFYEKKKNYRAAAARYLEATRWDPNFAEAYQRLAEAREELGQDAMALDAYRSFLQIQPDGKDADRAREAVTRLEAKQEKLPLAAGESDGN